MAEKKTPRRRPPNLKLLCLTPRPSSRPGDREGPATAALARQREAAGIAEQLLEKVEDRRAEEVLIVGERKEACCVPRQRLA